MATSRGVYEKRKGSGVWYINYVDQFGKERREKVGTKSQAQAAYTYRKSQVQLGKFKLDDATRGHQGLLLADAMKPYLKTAEAMQRDYGHTKTYGEMWAAMFAGRTMESVTKAEIEAWIAAKTTDGAKPSTINRQLVSLIRIFNIEHKAGRIDRNPLVGLGKLKENNARVRFITHEEQKILLDKLAVEWHPHFLIAIGTGLRLSELVGLHWKRVDLMNMQITVPRSKHGEKRTIPIHPDLAAVFRALPSRLRSQWVFPSPVLHDRHIVRDGTLKKEWEKAVDASEILDLVWHDLRHTTASRLVMAGADLRSVQEIMGHKTLAMTMRYAHLSPGHLKSTISLLNLGIDTQSTRTAIEERKGA